MQIAGFDDIPTLRDLSPGLTTVRLPLESMGELAVALTIGSAAGRLAGPDGVGRGRVAGEHRPAG